MGAILFVSASAVFAQQPLPASGARMLIVPRRIVSGERATLAVLDMNGRLTPNVTVKFSNGDRLTTDVTGRGLFVAPLNPGVISVSIEGRPGPVFTTVVSPTDAAISTMQVTAAPRIASLSDRFEISGRGFCGDADSNQVNIGGEAGLVLASAPNSLVILPPSGVGPGPAVVNISCGKLSAEPFSITLVGLDLEANTSPLAPGEHRVLTVHVKGTPGKIVLEARNLAPEIAELKGGVAVRATSSGGNNNIARVEVVGQKKGSFIISIRLAPASSPLQPGTAKER
ncbi:MAG TPA: hypothetical protein VOA64_20995 [Candidatus Dormibacteraeota bacterium]|nr:hypothetical protein [Candidatus Dormibacteraeota bacterium]